MPTREGSALLEVSVGHQILVGGREEELEAEDAVVTDRLEGGVVNKPDQQLFRLRIT